MISRDPGDVKFARVDCDADGDNIVLAGVAGKRLRVIGYQLTASTAGIVTVKDSTAVVLAELSLAVNTAVPYAGSVEAPAFETAAGRGLVIGTQVGQDVNGHLAYVEVS